MKFSRGCSNLFTESIHKRGVGAYLVPSQVPQPTCFWHSWQLGNLTSCCLAPYPWFPPSILLVKMKKHFRHLFPGCFHLLSPGAGIRSYHNMSEEKLGLAGNLILFGHKLPPHSRTFRRGNRKIKLLWQMTHFQNQGLGCDLQKQKIQSLLFVCHRTISWK